MLAQVALVSFALLALLSIVVDIGLVRVTQTQMQTAADAAALEGLRYRDVSVQNATGASTIDAYASDCLRRAAANRIVRRTFDDDLEPANGDPVAFGAGPIIELSEGSTSLHAGRFISVADSRVYKPSPQLNQQNAVDGDMVSGRFCYSADPAPSEDAGYGLSGEPVCDEPQRGFGAYARNDFNPSANPPQPPGQLQQCPAPDEAPPNPWPAPGTGSLRTPQHGAFLVRLRRSNELRGFSDQVDPDVASSGPALPLLFGQGAPIHGDDPAADYSVRRDGFTVRATAIAAAHPAMRVGLPHANPPALGVTPFALRDTFVAALTTAAQPVTINPAAGFLCTGTACAGANPPTAIGRFVDSLTDPTRVRWLTIATVGQALPAPAPVTCLAASVPAARSGYVPVYAPIAGGAFRIIGFAPVVWRRDPARPADPCAVLLSRDQASMAVANATAAWSGSLPVPAATRPEDVRELFDRHFERTGYVAYGALLAPVLVR